MSPISLPTTSRGSRRVNVSVAKSRYVSPRTEDGQRGQCVGRGRTVDRTQDPHSGELKPLVLLHEHSPDHRHRSRIGDLGKPLFGLFPVRILARQAVSQFLQLRLPLLVRQLLMIGLLLLGRTILGLDPSAPCCLYPRPPMLPRGTDQGGSRRCSGPGLAPSIRSDRTRPPGATGRLLCLPSWCAGRGTHGSRPGRPGRSGFGGRRPPAVPDFPH